MCKPLENIRWIVGSVCLGVWLCLTSSSASSSASASASASAEEPSIASSDLLTDVNVLETEYRALHPGLFRYMTTDDLKRAFSQLRQEFSQQRTLAQTYLALATFAAKIKCGHTYGNFFNQTRDVQIRLFESSPRLPFYFRWIDGKMVVAEDFTESKVLPRGSEVTRINGNTSAAILRRLLPLARADGSNDAKRIDQLSVVGDSKYESFDIYFPLIFPNKGVDWDLQVRLPGDRRSRRLVVKTLSFAERIAPIAAREANKRSGHDPQFQWQDLKDGTVYLRMPAWDMFLSKWEWKPWLNARLDQLSQGNTKALIIDLRGNEGGNDVGDEIIKRLIVDDLALAAMKRLVRYRSVSADLLPYLSTWDPSFKDWGADAKPLARPWPTAPLIEYFSLTGENSEDDARAVLHPVAPHFAGKVFVLVDASNSSATFNFETVVRDNHLGLLIGQPTGGNRRGINGGAFFFLTLPHSHIELDLPLIGTFPESAAPDAGLLPDVLVPKTAADVASGIDREMIVARQLIAASDK